MPQSSLAVQNSSETDMLKETQKMDQLERTLYRQGQDCKAGESHPWPWDRVAHWSVVIFNTCSIVSFNNCSIVSS